MAFLLAVVVALIVYGSLYPWDFHFVPLAHSPLWFLLHSWPRNMNTYVVRDVVSNISLYVPVGVCGYLAARRTVSRPGRILAPVALATFLSGSIEVLQLWDRNRVCSGLDLTCNVAGAAFGVWWTDFITPLFPNWGRPGSRSKQPGVVSSVFLMVCWLVYQVFPLLPSLSRAALHRKLSEFGAAPVVSLDSLASCSEWLVFALLAETACGRAAARVLGALALLLIPFHILILDRQPSWAEWLAAASGYALWLICPAGKLRMPVAAAMFSALLLIRGLAPFHFATQAGFFSAIPFRALFVSEWQSALLVLIRKVFDYGAAVWILWRAGLPIGASGGSVALLLAAIEAAQRYLPGRVAESTDPLMALGLCLTFLVLERSQTRTGSHASPALVQ